MRYARLDNNKVLEVVDLPEGVAMTDVFPPQLGFVACPAEVEQGWIHADGAFSAPTQIGPTLEELRIYAGARRYTSETGGIVVDGMAIATDRESQAMINGAYNLVTVSPQPVQFKAGAGFVTLTPEQVTSIALAVGQHVQACFAKEAEVVAGIDAGTSTTLAAIDEAFASL